MIIRDELPDAIWAWYFRPEKRDDLVKGGWDDAPDDREAKFLRSTPDREAAPDLLEALRRCVDDLERALRDGYEGVWLEGDFADHLAPYRAAIAKAEVRT